MMSDMRKFLAALTVPLALAACGDKEPEAAPKPTASSSAPSPTPTVAKVSDATICGQLVDDDDPSLFQQSIDLLTGDAQSAGDVPDELADLAARAESATLSTHLQVMADELDAIFAGEKSETADFQASALEVNNTCGNTPRF